MGYDGSAWSPTGSEMQRAAPALLTRCCACSRGANLVSVIQPCETGAQPATLFSIRLRVCVARWSGKPPLQVGFVGFGVQLEQSHFCLTASFWPVTNGICCDVFRPILKSWLSFCDELLIASSLRSRGLSVLILLHNHYFIKAAKTPHVTHHAIDLNNCCLMSLKLLSQSRRCLRRRPLR